MTYLYESCVEDYFNVVSNINQISFRRLNIVLIFCHISVLYIHINILTAFYIGWTFFECIHKFNVSVKQVRGVERSSNNCTIGLGTLAFALSETDFFVKIVSFLLNLYYISIITLDAYNALGMNKYIVCFTFTSFFTLL